MDKWKVITNKQDCGPGIYQEKFIIISDNQTMADDLKKMVKEKYPDAEGCEIPNAILKNIPFAFGFWVNKHDSRITWKDLKSGNVRKKIQN